MDGAKHPVVVVIIVGKDAGDGRFARVELRRSILFEQLRVTQGERRQGAELVIRLVFKRVFERLFGLRLQLHHGLDGSREGRLFGDLDVLDLDVLDLDLLHLDGGRCGPCLARQAYGRRGRRRCRCRCCQIA